MQHTQRMQWDKATIESYLQAYPQMKQRLGEIAKDLEELAAPQAVSWQKGGGARPRLVREPVRPAKRPLGRATGPAHPVLLPQLVWEPGESGLTAAGGRGNGGYADPTATTVLKLIDIKNQLARDDDYRRMKQFVGAVDRVLLHLREGQEFGTARQREDAMLMEQLLVERYFKNQLSDTGIYVKLGIPDRTYSRWKNEIREMVFQSLEEMWRICGGKTDQERVIIGS